MKIDCIETIQSPAK